LNRVLQVSVEGGRRRGELRSTQCDLVDRFRTGTNGADARVHEVAIAKFQLVFRGRTVFRRHSRTRAQQKAENCHSHALHQVFPCLFSTSHELSAQPCQDICRCCEWQASVVTWSGLLADQPLDGWPIDWSSLMGAVGGDKLGRCRSEASRCRTKPDPARVPKHVAQRGNNCQSWQMPAIAIVPNFASRSFAMVLRAYVVADDQSQAPVWLCPHQYERCRGLCCGWDGGMWNTSTAAIDGIEERRQSSPT
jgi:hypothetical protein